MKSMIRVVLVDPLDDSRQALQRLLGGITSVWLAEICSSYAAALKSVSENTPDVALVALDADPEQAITLIQSIVRANPNAVVLPASRTRDSETILRVVRAGAREFLSLPAEFDELLAAIERLVPADNDAGAATRRGAHVITVVGAAGGIGCTSVAMNLAATLAADNLHSVALADFDLLLGSVDTCLDIIPDQTLLEVAQNVDRLDLTLLKRTLSRHSSGLYVLPHPVSMEDVAKIDPEALRRVVRLLKAAFPIVVIDASKALQGSDFVALEMADTILLVVELDLACLRNSTRLMQLFRQYEGLADRVRVVVNRVGSSVTDISLKKAAETLNMPISWQIPNSFKVFSQARAKGVPIATESPGCRAHRAFVELAREFQAQQPQAPPSPKTPWARLAGLLL